MDQVPHQNGEYQVNGTVQLELALEDGEEFRGVMVCAFDDRGQLLASSNVGTFIRPRTERSVSPRTAKRPTYIVIDHPKFREYDGIVAGIFYWTNDSIRDTGGNPEEYIQEFEYIPPMEPGECGQTTRP